MSEFTNTEFPHAPDLKKFSTIIKNLKKVFDMNVGDKYISLNYTFPYLEVARDQSMYKNTLFIEISFADKFMSKMSYRNFKHNIITTQFLTDLSKVLRIFGVADVKSDFNFKFRYNNTIYPGGINEPIEKYLKDRTALFDHMIYIDDKGNILEESYNKYDGLPFEHKNKNGKTLRTFSQTINEEELKWHFDEENRIIKPLNETDWMFQMDDKLPFNLEKGKKVLIPEGKYHRLIKGTGDLTLEVKLIKTTKKNP